MTILLQAILSFQLFSPPPEGCEVDERRSVHFSEELLDYSSPGRRPDTLFYAEAILRFTFPGGKVGPESGPIYGEFFKTGIGAGLQITHLWRISPTLDLGPYVEFDYDSFVGQLGTDDVSMVLKPDLMGTFRTLAGAKLRTEWGNDGTVYGECNVGLGAIFFPSVEATLYNPGNDTRVELFSKSTALALDLGGTIGWVVGGGVELFASLDLEINRGPGRGKDVAIGSGHPGPMINGGVHFGVNLRF